MSLSSLPLRTGGRAIVIPARALADKRLDPYAIVVLTYLASVDDTRRAQRVAGWFKISQGALARLSGISRPKINRSLRDLEQAGYIDRRDHDLRGGGKDSHLYRIVFDAGLDPQFDRHRPIIDDEGTLPLTMRVDPEEDPEEADSFPEPADSDDEKAREKGDVTQRYTPQTEILENEKARGKGDVTQRYTLQTEILKNEKARGKDDVTRHYIDVTAQNIDVNNRTSHKAGDKEDRSKIEKSCDVAAGYIDVTGGDISTLDSDLSTQVQESEVKSKKGGVGEKDGGVEPASGSMPDPAGWLVQKFLESRQRHFPEATSRTSPVEKLRSDAEEFISRGFPADELARILARTLDDQMGAHVGRGVQAPSTISRFRNDLDRAAKKFSSARIADAVARGVSPAAKPSIDPVLGAAWERVRTRAGAELGGDPVLAWLKVIRPSGRESERIRLAAASALAVSILRHALEGPFGAIVKTEFGAEAVDVVQRAAA